MQSTVPLEIGARQHTGLLDTLPGRALLVVGASAFVALCAHLSVPLWFTPVPLSMQNFAVILVGLVLGPGAAFSAMVLYLAEGACGLPVFSPHGLGGVAQLLGPTGGFLWSYPFAAALAGALARKQPVARFAFVAAAAAAAVATCVTLALGAGWLAHELHLGAATAFRLGVAPFLPGEIAKTVAAAGIYATLHRRIRT